MDEHITIGKIFIDLLLAAIVFSLLFAIARLQSGVQRVLETSDMAQQRTLNAAQYASYDDRIISGQDLISLAQSSAGSLPVALVQANGTVTTGAGMDSLTPSVVMGYDAGAYPVAQMAQTYSRTSTGTVGNHWSALVGTANCYTVTANVSDLQTRLKAVRDNSLSGLISSGTEAAGLYGLWKIRLYFYDKACEEPAYAVAVPIAGSGFHAGDTF